MKTNNTAESKNNKIYYPEINIARSIALIFVILGHSFPDAGYPFSKLYTVCYSFHMGLFFILSGFVSARKLLSRNYKISTELKNKSIRLLVPYFVFSVITLILKLFTERFANNPFNLKDSYKILIGINPNGGLWFLWTLFIISAIFIIVGKLKNNLIYFIVFSAVAYIANMYIPQIFISNVLKFSALYTIGIIIFKYYDYFKKYLLNPIAGIASLVIFCIIHIAKVKTDYMITCLTASIFILFMSQLAVKFKSKLEAVYTIFDEFGTYSYDIYLLSYFVQVPLRVVFKSIIPIPELLLYFLMFVLGLIIPYLASKYILRKVPIFNLLLFGNKRKVA